MSKKKADSRHPSPSQLSAMTDEQLLAYANQEAELLDGQKQTAVPRLLMELTKRVK